MHLISDRAILVSFPKSGSNWVRYCIEYFSGMATPGSKRQLLHPDADLIIDRTHFLDKSGRLLLARHARGIDKRAGKPATARLLGDAKKRLRRAYLVHGKRIVLLLRDPCELYVRVQARDPRALHGYFSNILVFDRARRPKLLKYYDELVSDFEQVREILDFLGIGNREQGFDVEQHRKRSLELYKQGPDAPATEAELLNFRYHSQDLDPRVRAAIAALGREVLGAERYERYLGRFSIEGGDPHSREVTP